MSAYSPIVLSPIVLNLNNPLFTQEICRWSFPETFVSRILQNDIPQIVQFGGGRIWAYRDPDNEIVGFGTIDVCDDYKNVTAAPHAHIPLLAVNPNHQGRGHGDSILKHLIGEAVILARQSGGKCCDVLFLEVYVTSTKAISLYERNGFVKLSPQPTFDSDEQKNYFVMMRRV